VADMIANSNANGVRTEDGSRLEVSESVMKLGLTPEQMQSAWETVEKSLGEVVQAFAAGRS
jgi:hypothetical protein